MLNLINTRLESKITFSMKMMLIICSLLTAITPLNHYFRNIYKLFFIICLPWLIYLFIHHKLYKKVEFDLLLLFNIFYLLTILINHKYFINELAMVGYLSLFFFMAICPNNIKEFNIQKEIKMIALLILIVTFIYSICSFIMFLTSYQLIFEIGDSKHIFGMYQGRLWGLFNPNTGAMLYLAGIYSGVYFLKIAKKLFFKYFCILSIVLETITFILCQSRGAWVCVLVFVISYILFVFGTKSSFKKIYLISLVLFSFFVVEPKLRNTLNVLPTISHQNKQVELERLDHNKTANIDSFTSGRTGIWKAGLSGYKASPILGIGYRSVDDSLKQLPESVYINVSKGGLHNVYLTVLISSGICGLFIWLSFLAIVLYKGFKCFLVCKEIKIIYLLIMALLVGDLVESRIMFGMNFIGIIFWLLIGYLICLYYKFNEDIK